MIQEKKKRCQKRYIRPLLFLIIAGGANAGLNLFLVVVFHMRVAGVANCVFPGWL